MKFRTGYMDKALFDLETVIEDAKEALKDKDFDTIVGTGFSGGIVIPTLALALGKQFVLIRKEDDDSHHGGGLMLGNLGERWIFVDDFVSTGTTRTRVLEKIKKGATDDYHDTEYVGDYMYQNYDSLWMDAATANERWAPQV